MLSSSFKTVVLIIEHMKAWKHESMLSHAMERVKRKLSNIKYEIWNIYEIILQAPVQFLHKVVAILAYLVSMTTQNATEF